MGDEMGIETAIILGLTALSAVSTMSAANKEAEAAIKEGNIVAANKAKETKLKAARLQTSFLNSGLTLEGTPMATINDTFSTGLADINQISSNYNSKAKAAISKGRSSVLSSFASTFMGMGAAEAGLSKMFTSATESTAFALNDMGFGNTAFDMLEASDNAAGVFY